MRHHELPTNLTSSQIPFDLEEINKKTAIELPDGSHQTQELDWRVLDRNPRLDGATLVPMSQ